ncbi:MAG: rod shape-determining protein [Phycisphaerales bacterium]|nr:rod shape-determining protein [Phycisphaerales bacterium]
MRLRLRTSNVQPIAIDLGWSSIKLLQLEDEAISATTAISFPEGIEDDLEARVGILQSGMRDAMGSGRFKGRSVVVAMPAYCTLLQAMQLERSAQMDLELAMRAKLPPTDDEWMVRAIEVDTSGSVHRDVICQAMPRSVVLRHVEALHHLGLDVVGVVAQPLPMVAAFDHVNRRVEDGDIGTMYVDIGAGGTTCVIARGREIVQARSISVGGRHMDDCLAQSLKCDVIEARKNRVSWSPVAPKTPSATPLAVPQGAEEGGGMLVLDRRGEGVVPSLDPVASGSTMSDMLGPIRPVIGQLTDELRLCIRQHQDRWPDQRVDRVVFTGGEARLDWLCRDIVQSLHLAGQVGDPLAAMQPLPGLVQEQNPDEARPHWALVAGLASMQTGGRRRGSR